MESSPPWLIIHLATLRFSSAEISSPLTQSFELYSPRIPDSSSLLDFYACFYVRFAVFLPKRSWFGANKFSFSKTVSFRRYDRPLFVDRWHLSP